MSKRKDPSSSGHLTLKFAGIDDESTSEDENHDNQKQTLESVVYRCNGDSNSLSVNNCYGKIILFNFYINTKIFLFLIKENNSLNHNRNQLTSIPYKTYFEHRERRWTFISNTDLVVVNVAVSREHHFRLNPFL